MANMVRNKMGDKGKKGSGPFAALLFLLFLPFPFGIAFSESYPAVTVIVSGVMGGVDGESIFYYDIAIDKVEVDKFKVLRGEVVKFKITLTNRGETDWTIIDMRLISRGVVFVEKPVELGGWDSFDKMQVVLEWDTSNVERGSYPVKIEAPYNYDANGSDNEHRVHPDIVIR